MALQQQQQQLQGGGGGGTNNNYHASTNNKIFIIGNYRFTGKRLGKGNFARVDEAIHLHLNMKVAVKVMDITKIKEDYVIKNLYREAKIMSKLSHPCIAALFQTMEHGDVYYLVTELVGGGDLCSFIKAQKNGKLEEKVARVYARQLVSAISHMHQKGIVHRDLKMENIMLTIIQTQIKIVDFGLSNIYSDDNPLRTKCGSPEYAAPELFVEGKNYGPEVDLWSLGVILYGMVVGQLPFVSSRENHANSQERRKKLLEQINRGLSTSQKRQLAGFSIEFKSSLMPRLLVADSSKRITIGELLFHPWVTGKGRKSIRTNPLREIEDKMKSLACERISHILNMDLLDVQRLVRSDPQGNIAGMYNMILYQKKMQMAEGDVVTRPLYAGEPQKLIGSSMYSTPRPKTVKILSSDHSKIAAAAKMFESTFKNMHPLRKDSTKSAPSNKASQYSTSIPSSTRQQIPLEKRAESAKPPSYSRSRQQNSIEVIVKHSHRKISRKGSDSSGSVSSETNGMRRPSSAMQQTTVVRPVTPSSGKRAMNRRLAPHSARSSQSNNPKPETTESSYGFEHMVCDKLKNLHMSGGVTLAPGSKEAELMQKLIILETEAAAHINQVSARPSTGSASHTAERAQKRRSLLPVASTHLSAQRQQLQSGPSNRPSSVFVQQKGSHKMINTPKSALSTACPRNPDRYGMRLRSAPMDKKAPEQVMSFEKFFEKKKTHAEGEGRTSSGRVEAKRSQLALKDICEFAKKSLLPHQRVPSAKRTASLLPMMDSLRHRQH